MKYKFSLLGSQPIILKYAENEVVKYKIRGITSLHLPNSVKGENVKLKYSANFDLKAENSCLFLLRVSDVEIIGPDGKVFLIFMFRPTCKLHIFD